MPVNNPLDGPQTQGNWITDCPARKGLQYSPFCYKIFNVKGAPFINFLRIRKISALDTRCPHLCGIAFDRLLAAAFLEAALAEYLSP